VVIHPQKSERKNPKPQYDGHESFPRDGSCAVLSARRQAIPAPSSKEDSVEPKQTYEKEAAGNESKNFMLRGLGIEKEDTWKAKKKDEKTERQ
jgi:hypothetical protein